MAGRAWAFAIAFGLIACDDDDGGNAPTRDAMVEAPRDAGVREASVRDASVRDARVDEVADARVRATDARVVGDAATDAGVPSRASWLIAPGDKVFFVGNSFFNWQDRVLPEWVEAIGQAVTPKFPIDTGAHNVPGNNKLSWFFDQKASQDAIKSGDWDVFILQGEEFEPVDDKDGFHDAVREYHEAITAKGGRVMLFMTWDFKWNGGPDSSWFAKLASAYDEIGEELGIPVIPVGLIYNDTVKDPFPGQDKWFLTAGDLHQVAPGSAVNAYATFSMLTGIDAMGVDFDARGNDNNPEMLRYCADKSWPRVMERLHD